MKKISRPKNKKKKTVHAPPQNTQSEHRGDQQISDAGKSFPIIGIGASAGGLEALEHFLGAVPAGSGMACVIVQHLDPTYKGMMPELLQRATAMKVIQVSDRTKVKPDQVYVIPLQRHEAP